MSVYVVRLRGNGDAERRLVGIYLADEVGTLAKQVEPSFPTLVCEYAVVPHGCMYGPGTQRLYAEDEARNEVLSDDWSELFSDGTPLRWSGFNGASWLSGQQRPEPLVAARSAAAA